MPLADDTFGEKRLADEFAPDESSGMLGSSNARANSKGRQNAKARLAALKETYNSSKLEDMFPVRESQ